MESQIVREAQKRVQFVAEVYDYQSVHRDSPDGTWMPPTHHWVGDIFDTKMGRIYVPLDKYVRYPFYYDAKEGVDTADPRQIEYDFRYACSINKAVKIKEPPIDPPKDTDRKALPSGFFKKDKKWFLMQAYPVLDVRGLQDDIQLQTDIAIVRQMGDMSRYSPTENAGYLNILTDKGIDLPPVIPVSSYWIYSDGLQGEGYMLKTSSGWREVYVRRGEGGDYAHSYYNIHRDCCIRARQKGMGSAELVKGAVLPVNDLKPLLGYCLDIEILPSLGHERERDHRVSISYDQSPEDQFQIASILTTTKGDTNLVLADRSFADKEKHPNYRAVIFPVDVKKSGDGWTDIKIFAAKGSEGIFDFRGDMLSLEGEADPNRYVRFLKENLEQPIVPEFRRNSQLRVEVIL